MHEFETAVGQTVFLEFKSVGYRIYLAGGLLQSLRYILKGNSFIHDASRQFLP
jgi:hypothetical protein